METQNIEKSADREWVWTVYSGEMYEYRKHHDEVNKPLVEAAFVSGLSFDIGATYKLSSPELTRGASLLNMGPNIRYQGDGLDVNVPDTLETGGVLAKITQDFPIPLTFKVGVSKEFSFDMHVVDIAFDLNKSMDYSTVFNVGSEYTFNEMVSVRLGSLLGHDTAFYALGLGCRIGGIVVDYGLSNYGVFERKIYINI